MVSQKQKWEGICLCCCHGDLPPAIIQFGDSRREKESTNRLHGQGSQHQKVNSAGGAELYLSLSRPPDKGAGERSPPACVFCSGPCFCMAVEEETLSQSPVFQALLQTWALPQGYSSSGGLAPCFRSAC